VTTTLGVDMVGVEASNVDLASGIGSANIEDNTGSGSGENFVNSSVPLEGRHATGINFNSRGANCGEGPVTDDGCSASDWVEGIVFAPNILEILGRVSSGISGASGERASEGERSTTSRIEADNGEGIGSSRSQGENHNSIHSRGESLGNTTSRGHCHFESTAKTTGISPAGADVKLMRSSVLAKTGVDEEGWGAWKRMGNSSGSRGTP